MPAPAALVHLDPPADAGVSPAITWRVSDDVLARTTSCTVDHGSTYDIVGDGACTDHYAGTVTVDRRTWNQSASSSASFAIRWPEATVRAATTVEFAASAETFEVTITLEAAEVRPEGGETVVGKREWTSTISRNLA